MSRSKGSEYPAFSMSLVTLLAIVVIGIFSLFSLFLGFQSYGADKIDQAYYYMIIGVAGFAAMGFMFFRTRAIVHSKLDVPKVEVLTTLECPKCGQKIVRAFERGDYVFKGDIPCTKCDGRMVITRVHRKKKTEKERERERIGD
jgi:hypothetical protein